MFVKRFMLFVNGIGGTVVAILTIGKGRTVSAASI